MSTVGKSIQTEKLTSCCLELGIDDCGCVVSFRGDNCSKIDHGNSYTTLYIPKTTELYTLDCMWSLKDLIKVNGVLKCTQK